MVSYWVDYGFTGVTGSKAWRIPVALQAVFIIPILVLYFFVPESPRWLASHDRADQALSTISRLHGRPETDEYVMAEHREIMAALAYEHSIGSGSWLDLIRADDIRGR